MREFKQKEREFDLENDVPFIHNTYELEYWLKPKYVIEDMIESIETYNKELNKLRNLMRATFVIYECRTYPIKFKLTKKSRKVFELEFRHFFIMVILWRPFVEVHSIDNVIEEDSIIADDMYESVLPNIEDYIGTYIIDRLRSYHVESTKINYSVADVLYNLIMIDIDFGLIMGLNFSIKTFIDKYLENDRYREIMETTFDETMQPHEVEAKLDQLEKESISILTEDVENPIGVILKAGTGIKHKQLTEFTISQGLNPSLEGKTIPKVIQNSTLIGGLDRPSYLFLAGTGTRKSIVAEKKTMGKAGHFAKIVLMLSNSLKFSIKKGVDCGTKHLVPYIIRTKKHLEKLNGKYFKESLTDDLYQLMVSSKRKDLIGKTVYVRSVVTCCHGEDEFCYMCAGAPSAFSIDIKDGLSGYSSEEITQHLEQNILSTKHLLTTVSEPIVFNKEFYQFFDIVAGEITPKISSVDALEDINNYGIWLDPKTLEKIDELDDESLFNICISDGTFYVVDITDPNSEKIQITMDKEKEIYISKLFMDLRKANPNHVVSFSELTDDDKLFELIVENQELTKPLYMLMALLNKKKDDPNFTIEEMCQEFLDLLVECGMKTNITAAEIIMNRLVHSAVDIYRRPDFSKKKLEPYVIWPVSTTLEKNKSISMSLSHQNVKRQLFSEDTFTKRHAESYLDAFYKTNVSTANLNKYRKLGLIEFE